MRKTYRIPNVLNALVMMVQCAGIAACLLAARSVQSGGGLLLLTVAFAVVMNSVYATIHEAEHRMLAHRCVALARGKRSVSHAGARESRGLSPPQERIENAPAVRERGGRGG